MAKQPKGDEAQTEQEIVEETAPQPEPVIARRKVNRGSTRRVIRALDAFQAAAEAFEKELDLQFYEVNDKGERVGPAPVTVDVRAIRLALGDRVRQMLTAE